MKNKGIVLIMILALMLTLTACGKSEFGLSENDGKHMTITARNADRDAFFMVGSLDVADGEQIEIAANLTKGSVRVEIVAGAGGQDINVLPEMDGAAILTADLVRTDGASGTVPAGLYYLRATCLERATGTIQINVTPAETKAPETSASSVLPEEEQRRILEENRGLWAFDEGEYAPDWYYAFTDLDHNGLLELLSASTQGSGVFTYAHFYEVLPDGSGVRNLYHADGEIEGPDDWPEIILDTLPCYYDSAADRYYYVCSNDVRDGAWHGMTQLAALSLKDGTATIETLAAMDVQLTEDGEQRTYTDGEGKPISEEDYNSAVERRFAGMARSELRPDWNAVTRPQTEPVRQDGERFEGVIILEGMEETVRYEHVRNDALGFELDYDYENFVRRSEADREIFVSCWDDPEKPENYLELRYNPQDAGTVAANICAFLSGEYEVRRDDAFEIEQLGSCIRIDADEVKGGGYMPDQLQTVYVIPAGDGCRIAWERTYIVESEGFGRRFGYMMQTLSLLPVQGEKKLTDEQAAAAVRNCCIIQNPALAEIVENGEYPSYWEVQSSDGNEIVVLFRSYTGAQIRYYIDPVSGETTVTELVPGVTDEEQRTGESLNAWDYLF